MGLSISRSKLQILNQIASLLLVLESISSQFQLKNCGRLPLAGTALNKIHLWQKRDLKYEYLPGQALKDESFDPVAIENILHLHSVEDVLTD
ncbi:hypothetical protein Tco_0685795 [Tanacetum coccineum]